MGDFTQKLAHVCNACEKIMLAAQMSLQTTVKNSTRYKRALAGAHYCWLTVYYQWVCAIGKSSRK